MTMLDESQVAILMLIAGAIGYTVAKARWRPVIRTAAANQLAAERLLAQVEATELAAREARSEAWLVLEKAEHLQRTQEAQWFVPAPGRVLS